LLHFGSLITALGSFLDAKSHLGTWLVRIEDIDPPRELTGASADILKTLDAFGLHWDETVLYQSQQTALYREVLTSLSNKNLSYYCQCTRAEIKALGGIYQGHCRSLDHSIKMSSTRIVNNIGAFQYQDLIQDHVECNKSLAKEDFTLVRKDGLFAYQLAVVVDDIYQDINHIIRGCDLLEPTARQISFYHILNRVIPTYGHIPLAVTPEGYKLSKQNKAPAIDIEKPQPALFAALDFLGQQPPKLLIHSNVDEIITWAIKNWSIKKVPKRKEIAYGY